MLGDIILLLFHVVTNVCYRGVQFKAKNLYCLCSLNLFKVAPLVQEGANSHIYVPTQRGNLTERKWWH
jgi:hypothetical protein